MSSDRLGWKVRLRRIGHPKFGFIDHLGEQYAGEDLADGSDLEDGVLVYGVIAVDAPCAGKVHLSAAVLADDPDRDRRRQAGFDSCLDDRLDIWCSGPSQQAAREYRHQCEEEPCRQSIVGVHHRII